MDKAEQLNAAKEKAAMGGGEVRIEQQHAKGKLTARERLALLFDSDTFVETNIFVKHRCPDFDMQGKRLVGDGVVTGYGNVNGRPVFAFAQDFTILGGSLGEQHAEKIVSTQQAALKAGVPIVGLYDSGGARIQEGVNALSGFGKMFFQNTKASGKIPQLSAIMGPCAGGAVYSPALTDFIWMVKNTGNMFITGPQVIKNVTGEVISEQQLGGSQVHHGISGTAHFLAENDRDCLMQMRKMLGFLPSSSEEEAPRRITGDSFTRECPELDGLIPDAPNKAYNIKNVLKSIADDGEICELQAGFAPNIVTALIHLGGKAVGVIANQPAIMAGCLDINASDKAARFIRVCDCFNIALLTIVDVPGFLPGSSQEFGGIIRHGAKLLYAYSEAQVPKVTLILRKAYGGAYIGMCSKELGADEVIAWPTAEIAVMGPDGAVDIVCRKELDTAQDVPARRQQLMQEYKSEFASPYRAAEMGYVSDIILPRATRSRLFAAYHVLNRCKPIAKRHGNIPL